MGTTAPGQEAWKIPRGRLAGQVAEGTAAFTSGNTNQGKAVPEDRAGSLGGNHPEAKRVGAARWGSRVPLGGFRRPELVPPAPVNQGDEFRWGRRLTGSRVESLGLHFPFLKSGDTYGSD